MTATDPIRVLVVDDQDMVRAGFRMILEAQADIEVVGEAADGGPAIRAAATLAPDVVLMDIRMPNVDGLEATRQITARGTATARVIILTTFDDDEYVYEAIRHGASGFLLKDAPAADLLSVIRIVAAGDAILAPTVTRRLIDRFARRKRSDADYVALASLSAREREVFVLMARGLSNTEIGHALVVSEATVKTHVSHVLAKLDCRDRVQAVVTAYRSGVMDDVE